MKNGDPGIPDWQSTGACTLTLEGLEVGQSDEIDRVKNFWQFN